MIENLGSDTPDSKSALQVPFNRIDISGNEERYLSEVLRSRQLAGNGVFSKRCARFFEKKFDIHKAFLTSSCTDALEMCALLLNLGPGDEVILPSFTFVSTANAFLLRGVTLKFADSAPDHPNMDLDHVEKLISPRTRAIVVVHYGGVACDMLRLRNLAMRHGARIVEDAAHSIDAYYNGRPLGSIGDLAAFSFHETKNVAAGEGGLLAVNDPALAERAEIIWEKGTNRCQFYRGEIDKYGWIDVGSSFLASELTAAVLWAQLERLEDLQKSRLRVWSRYHNVLSPYIKNNIVKVTPLPEYATNNAHLYAIICSSLQARTELLSHMRARGILATFHYQPLHNSPFFAPRYTGEPLHNADRYGDCLLRLPVFAGMSDEELEAVVMALEEFYSGF
jgi:dTDP-4-amino-4,6-dideoxygalactose transaminase